METVQHLQKHSSNCELLTSGNSSWIVKELAIIEQLLTVLVASESEEYLVQLSPPLYQLGQP